MDLLGGTRRAPGPTVTARKRTLFGIRAMFEENRLHLGVMREDANQFLAAITTKADDTDRGLSLQFYAPL